jgi:hypothetical protein
LSKTETLRDDSIRLAGRGLPTAPAHGPFQKPVNLRPRITARRIRHIKQIKTATHWDGIPIALYHILCYIDHNIGSACHAPF